MGPTLQETLDWLNANLYKAGSSRLTEYEDGKHFFYSAFSPFGAGWKNCTVRWRNHESVVRSDPGRTTEVINWTEFTVDFSTLDPNKVSIVDHKLYWAIEMHTTNEDDKITTTEASEPSVARPHNVALVIFGDKYGYERQLAERIASALRNAIKLCGGKKEPF